MAQDLQRMRQGKEEAMKTKEVYKELFDVIK